MPEIDMFAHLLGRLGEPEQALKVTYDEAQRYAGRVPDAMLRFWREHGRGAYKGGSYWICDPAPYQGVIEAIFKDDPEFDPALMTAVGYDAFGRISIWHQMRYEVTVDLLTSTIDNPPDSSQISSETGQKFTPDFSIGCFLTQPIYRDPETDEDDEDLVPKARARLGALEHNEVYGFFPALQLGGTMRVENLRRVKAPEHMMLLASLQPLTLTRLTDPEPGHPYGRVLPVRHIGVQ
jgi:hypothetical protein